MVDDNWIEQFDIDEGELEQLIQPNWAHPSESEASSVQTDATVPDFTPNSIISAKVIGIGSDLATLDIGYKTEGVILTTDLLRDFDVLPDVGEEIPVAFFGFNSDLAPMLGSCKELRCMIAHHEFRERFRLEFRVGQCLNAAVQRRIRGGFLVNACGPTGLNSNMFLPLSQLDVRRVHDAETYIGTEIQCQILLVDLDRKIIVVSRRKLIEAERAKMKAKFLKRSSIGDIVTGVVVTVAQFGVFVDLGGIDGLLHVIDMSHSPIKHPTDLVNMGDTVEVKILHIDYENERVALGLKQLDDSAPGN